jgi:hypothetical protein
MIYGSNDATFGFWNPFDEFPEGYYGSNGATLKDQVKTTLSL